MSAGILFVIFIAAALFAAVPIAIALGFTSILPFLADSTFAATPELIIRSMIGGVNSFPILAVPMFVLSGIIMAHGGVSKKIFDMISYFIGNKTGGIPCAVVLTCLFYGAISGSGPATTAAVGSMTIPILVGLGYDKVFSTALVAVAGGLGVIIPPSIPFILYGMSSGASIGKLFIAGIIPGLLIGACLMGYAYYYCRKNGEDKEKLKQNFDALKSQGFMKVLRDSFWALFTPVIILGSIYSGIASPTEAATISVFYALVISLFVYKSLTFRDLPRILREAVGTYGPILFVLAAAVSFARVLTLMQVPQLIAETLTSTFTGKVSILLVINIFLLIVGMIMDTSPAILILTPILVPIAQSVGVDLVHFGIIMTCNLAIGFVTPPFGINLFVASSLTDIEVMKIAKKATPFIISFIVTLLLITFIPEISLLLTR